MKKPNCVIAALTLIPAAMLVLSACSSGGTSAEPNKSESGKQLTTLKVATIGLTSDGSLITGIDQGFFKDEGLEIETSIVANPPAGLAAAQSGQVDVAYSPSIPLLNALSQGVPLKVIGAADGDAPGSAQDADPTKLDDTGLIASASSGITDIKGLAGKTIAVPARKAQLEVVIADELKLAGVDPATGVKWVVLDFTSAVAALKSGTVDAAGLVSPFTAEAADVGAVQLAAPSVGFFEEGATGLWVAGTSTIKAKPDAIAAFRRAIVKANEYATAHADEAIQAGLEYTKSKLTIDQVKLPVWPTEVVREDLNRPNEKMVKLGFLAKPVDLDGVISKG